MLTLLAGRAGSGQTSTAAAPAQLTFRTGVDRVLISAVVRDRNGALVTDLVQSDFEVLDDGERRPITDFRAERAAVVDDDESTRDVVSAALQTGRADVHVAASAAEARRWLSDHAPSLIVADLGMPGVATLVRRVR